jgi:hypothetical protein
MIEKLLEGPQVAPANSLLAFDKGFNEPLINLRD